MFKKIFFGLACLAFSTLSFAAVVDDVLITEEIDAVIVAVLLVANASLLIHVVIKAYRWVQFALWDGQ